MEPVQPKTLPQTQAEDEAPSTGTGEDEHPEDTKRADPPPQPWGNRGVTSPRTGTKGAKEEKSSLNVRINLDLRADVMLELHAVIQGNVTIGLF
ncbi:hypothetical protein BDW75DRAFT_246546 [Aspergillus navahoensis]